MKEVFSFIIQFLTENQDKHTINMPVLILALVILSIALWICIVVSKKNKLYIRQKKKNREIFKNNEVVT